MNENSAEKYLNEHTSPNNLLSKKRLDISKFPQFHQNWCADGYPIQAVQSKIAKTYCYSTVSYKFDPTEKTFDIVTMINANTTENKHISYDIICDIMGWEHGFTIDKERMIPCT